MTYLEADRKTLLQIQAEIGRMLTDLIDAGGPEGVALARSIYRKTVESASSTDDTPKAA